MSKYNQAPKGFPNILFYGGKTFGGLYELQIPGCSSSVISAVDFHCVALREKKEINCKHNFVNYLNNNSFCEIIGSNGWTQKASSPSIPIFHPESTV